MPVSSRFSILILLSGLVLWGLAIFSFADKQRSMEHPTGLQGLNLRSGAHQQLPSGASGPAIDIPAGLAYEIGNIPESIFVSIASYRDVYCFTTLETVFSQAKHPERVRVGLVQQNNPMNPIEECSIRDPNLRKWQRNVATVTVPYWESRGPTWARWIASRLWRNETYFMQIDAHSVFLRHWDDLSITELKRCDSPKPVFTAHPGAIPDEYTKSNKVSPFDYNYSPYVCGYKVDGDKLPRFEGILAAVKEDEKPWLVPFSGAGLIFGRAEWVKDAPFDPYIDFLFSGEELLIALRLWTAGWDIFTITRNVIFHNYNRVKNPSNLWADTPGMAGWWYEQQESVKRLRILIHGCMEKEKSVPCPSDQSNLNRIYKRVDLYGPGKNRTVTDYFKFAQLDWMAGWPKDSLAVGTNKAGSNSQWCQKRFKNNAEVEWTKPKPK